MLLSTVKLFSVLPIGLKMGNFKGYYNHKFLTLKLVAHKMV